MQDDKAKSMSEQKLYKAQELADILQINVQTIYRLAKDGKIESYRIGRSMRFPMPERNRQCLQQDSE